MDGQGQSEPLAEARAGQEETVTGLTADEIRERAAARNREREEFLEKEKPATAKECGPPASPEALIGKISEGLPENASRAEVLSHLTMWVTPLAGMANLQLEAVLEGLKVKLGLRAKDLAALEKDIRQARKTRGGRGAPPTIESLEEVRRLHPAVDFQNGHMTLGFRVNLPEGETGLLLLVSDGGKVVAEIDSETVDLGNKVYEVPTREGVPWLEDVWGLPQVKAVLESPTVDSAVLWEDLKAALRTYLDLPEPAYGLLAAWAVATHFAQLFAAVPFLHFIGPKESGKSKTLEALACLCFNAWKGRDITAAALGDTVEGMQGTVLVDQAERLGQEQNGTGNLVGLLADSYRKAGGKRRIVDTSNGRCVLEFSTYGFKAFASQKELDPDLKDRCARIPMVRTRKRLPDLEGYEPVWKDLRDRLYRFALTHFLPVGMAYEGFSADGTRMRDLWRPLGAVLWAVGVGETEVASIYEFFLKGIETTRHEVTEWEAALLDFLKTRAAEELNAFEISAQEILNGLDLGENGPGTKWIGNVLSTFNIPVGRKQLKTEGGRRPRVYIFEPARTINVCEIYLRDTPPNDLFHLFPDGKDSNHAGFEGTGEKPGTCAQVFLGGGEGQEEQVSTCSRKTTCSPENPVDSYFPEGEQVEQVKLGGSAEKNFNIFPQARPVANPGQATLRLWDPERQRRAAAIVNQGSAPMEELFSGDEVKL